MQESNPLPNAFFSIYYRPKRLVGDPAVMMIVKLNYIEVKKQWDYYTVQ